MASEKKIHDLPSSTVKDIQNDETKEVASDHGDKSSKSEEVEKKEKEGSLKDFVRIFHYSDSLDRILYGIAFFCAIIAGAALPLMTLVFGSSTSTFNSFASGQSDAQQFTHKVDHLVLYFVYLFVARYVIGYIGGLSVSIAAARTTRALRKAFLESTLRQEVWYFDSQSTGSAATQVTTNGNRINQGIAEKLYTGIQGISLFFSAYIVALVKQWKLALITMSVVPLIIIIASVCIALDAPIEARIVRLYSRAAVIAQDAIGSIKTIHAFGAQDKIVNRYDEYLEKAHNHARKKSVIYGTLFCTQSFLVMCGTALAFWEGFRLFLGGDITNVGTVFTVVLSVILGSTSVMLIVPQFQSITNASSAAAELFLVIDKPSLLDPMSTEGMQPSSCEGEIIIRDLRFAYPTRPTAPVLQGLNLSIPAGKTTALVGPSGCGKSTIVGLLERWYEPSSGQIMLDGHDISEYNTKWLRSNIRLVQQEPTLFAGTIFENVAKGFVGEQLEFSREKQMSLVQEACIASNAHDFIEKLPEGYHTQVGERASMLSGGQRQRIAIARSIISDPKVLLLDEATSALDPRAEMVVQDALQRVSINKTTLVIAHKLATVKAADNIAVMTSGNVIEQGSHAELIARDGLYAAMVRAQDLGGDGGEAEIPQESEDGTYNKEGLDRTVSLQRTKSYNGPADLESNKDKYGPAAGRQSFPRHIFRLLKEHPDLYHWYALTALGSIIGGGTYPAQAIIFSHLIHVFTLTGASARQQADFYSLMFFVLALANLFAYFTIGWAFNIIGQTITHRLRREMVERVVQLDQDFFDRPENSSGALTSKLSSVPTALQEMMSGNLGLIINLCVNILACSVLAIAVGWKLGLTIVFGGLTVLVASGYYRVRLEQKIEQFSSDSFASSAGLATEAVTSIRTVSSLNLESSILKQYSDTLDGIIVKFIPGLVITLIPFTFSQSVDFLIIALGFWYGSQLIARGEYSVSQFFIIFIAVVFGGQACGQFFQYTSSITKAREAARYLFWLRSLKAEIRETDENRDKGPRAEDGTIEVEDLHFRYKQREASRVLRGISMKIEPGTYAAFVGPSGCGKSTVISLLERFYDPLSGRITLQGDDISLMSPLKYRRYMSLVQQEPPLYLGSVRDNIAIGLTSEPSDEDVNEACRQANALEFISSLPEGLNTPCGSKGLQFSGGQRQRIAVARALIRKPRLLLLDEATSALDTQSERIVQKALDEAASSRTTIAVAHRLSTIKHADIIFLLEDGKIVEAGTHEELQRLKGRYYAMCLAQSLDRA